MIDQTTHYKKLPKLIRNERQGFDYYLMERTADIAWYEARYLDGKETKGWVVIRIERQKEHTFPNGDVTPAMEVFPRESRFGSKGWFYMPKSKSIAKKHFFDLAGRKEG